MLHSVLLLRFTTTTTTTTTTITTEQICRLLVFVPRKQSNLNCGRSIAGVLGLVDLLRMLPSLSKLIAGLHVQATTELSSTLLETLADNLSADVFSNILAMIRESMALNSLDDDATSTTGQGSRDRKSTAYNLKQRRQIFCVKPGLSGNLDVARATYLLCLESIDALFATYSTKWDIVGMELRHEKNTITIRMPVPVNAQQELPKEFDIHKKTKKYLSGSTKELGSLVKRVQECIQECYHHTFVSIQQLLVDIRNQIQNISSIADSLAYLDLLTTFSTLSSNYNYTRPVLLQQSEHVGTIAIQQGRHPVAERLRTSIQQYVPNDVLLTSGRNVQLVLGPNSSGKSTYLRTVAVTVVLAQSGCFVPAKRFQLQLRDRILSRLSCEDDCEKNLSTFELESSEAAYICRSLTSCSLILFDEFGRSTSSKEALSLSYAVAGTW
jgi:DNA mismatch repair protein MSH4